MRIALLFTFLVVTTITIRDSTAQTVPDSIRMDLHLYSFQYQNGPNNSYYNCGSGIYATWTDTARRILGIETAYSDYALVATEGMYVPSGAGQLVNGPFAESLGITVPDGSFAHWPSLGTGVQAGGKYSEACNDYRSDYARLLAGERSGLNAGEFWIPQEEGGKGWYAVYNVDAGTAIAEFKWDQTTGTTVAFDGRFPLSREVEVTGRKPVVKYEWDFGDDSDPVMGSAPNHTYSEPGTYPVTLTVTDDDDQTDVVTYAVNVRGVVLEYSVFASSEANILDTLGVTGIIKNVGTLPAFDVSASRAILRIPTYPENPATRKNALATATRSTSDTTYAQIEPGQSVFVYQFYRIDKNAEQNVDNEWIPTPVDWESRIVNVRGYDENGLPAEINDLCDAGGCPNNKTRIFIEPLSVVARSSTVAGETTVVNAGLKRFTSPEYNFLYSHLVPPLIDSALCYSGCLELEITVRNPQGLAVEGASVDLSRVLTDTRVDPPSIVTPAQGDGVFCTDSGCASVLTLAPTDENGQARARFWVPGVIWPVNAAITAKASKTGFATGEKVHEISIQPTLADVGLRTTTPSNLDMDVLTVASGLQLLSGFDPLAFCKSALGKIANKAGSIAGKAAASAIDAACGDQFKKYIYDYDNERQALLDRRKRGQDILTGLNHVTTALTTWWFEGQFQLSTKGTGGFSLMKSPPFWTYDSELIPTIIEANRKLVLQRVQTGQAPTINLDLHEVSHKDAAGKEFKALHFDLWTTHNAQNKVEVKKLITKGYAPITFLTQGKIDASLSNTVSPDDESIDVSPSVGNQASSVLAKRSVASIADDTTSFVVGNVIEIDPEQETAEKAQIVAISGASLELSVPLKYAHSAGARILVVDSLDVEPPAAPINIDGASGQPGVSTTPVLSWYTWSPSSSYALEVATDTLFENIVQSYDDLAEPTVTLSELTDRTRYYWRVAATNLLGRSEWSTWYSFFTGRPIGDDFAEARTVPDDLYITLFAWHVGSTGEQGEVAASCGTGDNSIWYQYTPSVSQRVAFDTFESAYNTVLSVWTGSDHPLTEIGCNNDYDNGPHPTVAQSYVEVDVDAGTTYYIRVAGESNAEGALFLSIAAPTQVAVEEVDATIPAEIAIDLYPNPTASHANVIVQVPATGRVTMRVYDMLGRERVAILDKQMDAGRHEVEIDVSALAAGVYVVRAVAGDRQATRLVTVKR